MERLAVGDRQIKNLNFRRPQFPQIRQRDQRNQVDNQIMPPFQENIVANDLEDTNIILIVLTK